MNTSKTAFASNEDIFFDLYKYISWKHPSGHCFRSEKFSLFINGSFPEFWRHAFDFRSFISFLRTGLCQKAMVNKNSPATERNKFQERGDHGSS